MHRRSFSVTLAAALLSARAAEPASPQNAATFIATVGRALQAAVAGVTNDADRRQRLVAFLQRIVAIDKVSRFCLGRYWRRATEAQRRQFQTLLIEALANGLANRLGSYNGSTQVTTLREVAAADGVEVQTIVSTGNQAPARVTWLVDTEAAPFRILDVEAEGISLRQSLRSDYGAFLDRHGGDIALFLQALAQHVGG